MPYRIPSLPSFWHQGDLVENIHVYIYNMSKFTYIYMYTCIYIICQYSHCSKLYKNSIRVTCKHTQK